MAGKRRDPQDYVLSMDESYQLAEQLLVHIQLGEFSQAELARSTGIHPSHLSNLLRKKRPFMRHHIQKLAEFWQLSELDFLDEMGIISDEERDRPHSTIERLRRRSSDTEATAVEDFLERHKADVTLAEAEVLKKLAALQGGESKDEFWSELLRLMRSSQHR